MEPVHSPFAAWEAFYVIVGTSGGALTGLQFVVMALVAESPVRSTSLTIAAFGTPTVVHFCIVLLVAGILSAPWPAVLGPALALASVGIAGVAYVGVVVRRAKRQSSYEPVLEDWLWHCVFPMIAYLALTAAAVTLTRSTAPALFVIAGASLVLLFVGIHNSWDTVTFVTAQRVQPPADPPDGPG